MKNLKLVSGYLFSALLLIACSKNDVPGNGEGVYNNPVLSGTYIQEDQMGRPAVNTVFVSSSSKDEFNRTTPDNQGNAFQGMFEANLLALSPAYANGGLNALGMDATTFTTVLATDVLNVSLDGTTTFYDGTNLLTGRALADDVITVELLLIFGGEDFTEYPALSNDHVDENDKPFLTSFPYLASPW